MLARHVGSPCCRRAIAVQGGAPQATLVLARTHPDFHWPPCRPAGKQLQRMVVRPEAALVRPFVVCAILRGVTLDPVRYNSFIDLQVPAPPARALYVLPWGCDACGTVAAPCTVQPGQRSAGCMRGPPRLAARRETLTSCWAPGMSTRHHQP